MRKFIITDDCIGCGLCMEICPEVFRFDKDGNKAEGYSEPVQSTANKAQEAMESCPVSAIVKE